MRVSIMQVEGWSISLAWLSSTDAHVDTARWKATDDAGEWQTQRQHFRQTQMKERTRKAGSSRLCLLLASIWTANSFNALSFFFFFFFFFLSYCTWLSGYGREKSIRASPWPLKCGQVSRWWIPLHDLTQLFPTDWFNRTINLLLALLCMLILFNSMENHCFRLLQQKHLLFESRFSPCTADSCPFTLHQFRLFTKKQQHSHKFLLTSTDLRGILQIAYPLGSTFNWVMQEERQEEKRAN